MELDLWKQVRVGIGTELHVYEKDYDVEYDVDGKMGI